MSIQFNDTTTNKGLVQFYEEEIGSSPGDVSGNATKLSQFTARVNTALDRYFAIAIQASGKWQLDSSNHSDYPFIETDLISGQRDYSFLTDGSGNMILDIYKVMVKDAGGVYQEIYPVDQQTEDVASFYDDNNTTGQPSRYDKTGNGIFLDSIPNYSWRTAQEGEKGLKIFINRESSYFTSADTTKKAGYPYHQEYFYLKPAYEYARRNNLSITTSLEKEILKLEGDVITGRVGLIAKAYGNRAKDEETRLEVEEVCSI
jgi:hypothetical protein